MRSPKPGWRLCVASCGLLALLLLTVCPADGPAIGSGAKHVIVISLDTTRTDHLGCYGHDWISTPRLDQLAAESILLTNYRTVVPVTLPSHVSLLTGTYPHNHGVVSNGYMVNQENLMLAEILQKAGFHTAAFLGSFALESRFDFNQGFDHFDENFDIEVGTFGADQNQRTAESVNEAVFAHLDSLDPASRLFLFVHYFDAHAPHTPPPPFDTMYGPGGESDIPLAGGGNHRRPVPGEEFNRARRLYAGEVSYMDRQVGNLLDHLRGKGILDTAILVVTSDHGENLGDHGGMISHGWTTYQSEMDAVGIVRLPGAALAGTRVNRLMASIDIMPTILGRLGMPVPPGVDGEPLDLEHPDAPAPPRIRFGEAARAPESLELPPHAWPNFGKMVCVWEEDLKYQVSIYKQIHSLHNLVQDPYETENLLAGKDPRWEPIARELRGRLETWTREAEPLPSRFDSAQYEDTVRRLKALGYLQE